MFIQEVETLREDSVEDDLVIEGEYVSEKAMKEIHQWTELAVCT